MKFQLTLTKWQACILLLFCGCIPLDDGIYEKEGMTLEEYNAFTEECESLAGESVPASLIMPERASRISYGSWFGRDSWETWWKIEGVNTAGKAALISTLERQFEKIGFVRVEEEARTSKNISTIPEHWQKPVEERPSWWRDCVGSETRAWEKEIQSPSIRSLGWLVTYDQKLQIVYVWHWNHQHSSLGWSCERREVVPLSPISAPCPSRIIHPKSKEQESCSESVATVLTVKCFGYKSRFYFL